MRRRKLLTRAVSVGLLAVASVVSATAQQLPAPSLYVLLPPASTHPRLLCILGDLRHSRDCPARSAMPMHGGQWDVGARRLHALTFAACMTFPESCTDELSHGAQNRWGLAGTSVARSPHAGIAERIRVGLRRHCRLRSA